PGGSQRRFRCGNGRCSQGQQRRCSARWAPPEWWGRRTGRRCVRGAATCATPTSGRLARRCSWSRPRGSAPMGRVAAGPPVRAGIACGPIMAGPALPGTGGGPLAVQDVLPALAPLAVVAAGAGLLALPFVRALRGAGTTEDEEDTGGGG